MVRLHHRYIFGVGWLKLADSKDCLPHPTNRIFGVNCVMTANTKNRSSVLVDTKNGHFLYHTKGIGSDGQHQRPVTRRHYKLFFVVVAVRMEAGAGGHLPDGILW
jgi:hypothetical protein